MYPIPSSNGPVSTGSDVPYFYQGGVFERYGLPAVLTGRKILNELATPYRFSTELPSVRALDRNQTVEDIIAHCYFAPPPGDPITAILSDKKTTFWLGIEEAHNLLLAKQTGTKESGLETSIRMIRQYGQGYVLVDQSASLLSRVAFANSYVTLALSQKLRADIRTMSGAMNLTEEQEEALSTLSIGSAVVRLADEHPEPFLIRIPRCSIREGSVSDSAIRRHMATYSGESAANSPPRFELPAVPPLPTPDKNNEINPTTIIPRPPSPERSRECSDSSDSTVRDSIPDPPLPKLSRETIRFLTDIAARPLSTTVSRYQRLHLSRRRGNAIRRDLLTAGIIEAVPLATRTGQVMLFQLTDFGRQICNDIGVDPGTPPRASLEHQFWAHRVARQYENAGYNVALEQPIAGDGQRLPAGAGFGPAGGPTNR